MDLNLTLIAGRLATRPDVHTYADGTRHIRLLVTTTTDQPRRRVDVLPILALADRIGADRLDQLADLDTNRRVWITGRLERRALDSADGRRSRIELVADDIVALTDPTLPGVRP